MKAHRKAASRAYATCPKAAHRKIVCFTNSAGIAAWSLQPIWLVQGKVTGKDNAEMVSIFSFNPR
jgi:hypothetical protein